jgi:hypothetical protein
MIFDGPVLGSATLREVSWSKSNSSWDTYRFKPLNATLVASSVFDQQSVIELDSSLIPELTARLWKDCRPPGTWPDQSIQARQAGITAWSMAGEFAAYSQLRTLVGLRLLRYDLFLRKAGCGT